jgi:hypothetical protein
VALWHAQKRHLIKCSGRRRPLIAAASSGKLRACRFGGNHAPLYITANRRLRRPVSAMLDSDQRMTAATRLRVARPIRRSATHEPRTLLEVLRERASGRKGAQPSRRTRSVPKHHREAKRSTERVRVQNALEFVIKVFRAPSTPVKQVPSGLRPSS